MHFGPPPGKHLNTSGQIETELVSHQVAEQKIHDTAIQYIAEIRNREKFLIEELKNLYGKDLMEYIENKKVP